MEPGVQTTPAVIENKKSKLNKNIVFVILGIVLVIVILALGIVYANSNKPVTNANNNNQNNTVKPAAQPTNLPVSEVPLQPENTNNPNLVYIENCSGLKIGYDPKIWQKGLSDKQLIDNINASNSDFVNKLAADFNAYNATTIDCKSNLPPNQMIITSQNEPVLMRFTPLGTNQPCWACDGEVSETLITYNLFNTTDRDKFLNPKSNIQKSSDGSLVEYIFGTQVVKSEAYEVNGIQGRLVTSMDVGPRGVSQGTYFAFEKNNTIYYISVGKSFESSDYYSQIQKNNGIVTLTPQDAADYNARVIILKEFLKNTSLAVD